MATKRKLWIVLIILLLMSISPILGLLLPFLELIFPMAIAFRMPLDSPPFAESIVPLMALISTLLGVIGFGVYFGTKGRGTTGLTLFIFFNIFYSSMAFLIWLVFFGSRFFRYFPIDLSFYVYFIYLAGRHIALICLLVFSRKILRKQKNIDR